MSISTPSKSVDDPSKEMLEIVSSSESLMAITKGEIDIQIATAKRFPRNLSEYKRRARDLACSSKETAEDMTYVLARGGKTIVGPSARLAEIIGPSWGNLRVASRVIGIDATHATVQGVCFDLERNYARSSEVKRRITDKEGRRYSEDMITVTCNAAGSIAERNAIFRTIPKSYWEPIWEEAQAMAKSGTDAASLENDRGRCLEAFSRLGVEEGRLCRVVGKTKASELSRDDLTTLRGLYTAVQEGSTTVEESFPLPEGVKTARDLRDVTAAKAARSQVVPPPRPAPPPPEELDAPVDEPPETSEAELAEWEKSDLFKSKAPPPRPAPPRAPPPPPPPPPPAPPPPSPAMLQMQATELARQYSELGGNVDEVFQGEIADFGERDLQAIIGALRIKVRGKQVRP